MRIASYLLFGVLLFLVVLVWLMGVCVKYHRNTGPDFEIISNGLVLKSEIEFNSKKYKEFYSNEPLDYLEGIPFYGKSKYFVICKPLKMKGELENNFPVVNIIIQVKVEIYYLLLIMITLFIFFSLHRMAQRC